MKKLRLLIVVLGVSAVIALWGVNVYNGLVEDQENVETAWSQVENQYQRRADLVPNLVATVKGYAAHEQQTLVGVMEARAKATEISIEPDNITAEQLGAFQTAQRELTRALERLLLVAENYPSLKADEEFRNLQSQLENSENRIAEARQAFNNAAMEYNKLVRRFPSNIVARLLDFGKKAYFEAEPAAAQSTDVAF